MPSHVIYRYGLVVVYEQHSGLISWELLSRIREDFSNMWQ